MPTTAVILSHETASVSALKKALSHETYSLQRVEKILKVSATDSRLKKLLPISASSARDLSKILALVTECPGVETEPGELIDPPIGSSLPVGFRAPGPTEWDRAWRFNDGICTLELFAGVGANTDVSEIPYKFEVSHARSQATEWNVYIVDDLGTYHPVKAGDFHNVFGKGKNHRMKALLTWGGRQFTYSGYPTRAGHQRSSEDAGWFRDLVWGGVDKAKSLSARSVTMKTVRSTRTKIARAFTTVAEIIAAAGLLGPFSFVDFPIRLFHRQNQRYGDFLTKLLEVPGGLQWQMRGDEFHCYDPLDGHGPIYHYTVAGVMYGDSWDSDIADVVTQASVRRIAETDEDGGGEPQISTRFGKYSFSFDQPMYGVQWEESELSGGSHSDFIGRDVEGNVVAVRDIRGGVWPDFLKLARMDGIKSIEYTFGADAGFDGDEGYGKILFTGTSGDHQDDESFPDAFNADFEYTGQDDDLVEEYGEILEELEVNEVIATRNDAIRFVRGWLNKRKAALFPLQVTVPLNPALVDGARVKITDLTLGVTISRVVITSTHTFSDDPNVRRTVFTIGGYR